VPQTRVLMEVCVNQTEWEVFDVSVCNLIQDNDVKIVSSINKSCFCFHTSPPLGIDPCASQPCRNGGICQPVNGNSYQCICPSGYSGFDCSTRKLYSYLIRQTKVLEKYR
jgi:hypothetical protein